MAATLEEAQARFDQLQLTLLGKMSSGDKRRFAEEMTELAEAHPGLKPRQLTAAEFAEAREKQIWGRDPDTFSPRQAAILDELLNGVARGPARDALLREYQSLTGAGAAGAAGAPRDIRSARSIELGQTLLGMTDRADPARRALVAELETSLAADQAAADQAAANSAASADGGGAS